MSHGEQRVKEERDAIHKPGMVHQDVIGGRMAISRKVQVLGHGIVHSFINQILSK